MSRASWMAGCLLLMVAPRARAVTINITENAPDLITFNTGDTGGSSLNVTKKAGDLGKMCSQGARLDHRHVKGSCYCGSIHVRAADDWPNFLFSGAECTFPQ